MSSETTFKYPALANKIQNLFEFYTQQEIKPDIVIYLSSLKELPDNYLEKHKALMFDYLEYLEKKVPILSEKNISELLIKNFFNVFIDDFNKKSNQSNDAYHFINTFNDEFPSLIDYSYINFHTILSEKSPFNLIKFCSKENISQTNFNTLMPSSVKDTLKFQIQTGIFHALMEKIMVPYVLDIINKDFDSQEFLKYSEAINYFVKPNFFTKTQKRCFLQINQHICAKLFALNDEDFIYNFPLVFQTLNKTDKAFLNKPFFNKPLIEKVTNFSIENASIILGCIENNIKGLQFDNLKNSIHEKMLSKFDFKNSFEEKDTFYYSKTLSISIQKFNLLFPQTPDIIKALNGNDKDDRIRLSTNSNPNTYHLEYDIEFLTPYPIKLTQTEIIELFKVKLSGYTLTQKADYFFQMLETTNNALIRADELNQTLESNTTKQNLTKNKKKL